jgi:hypothetical protein
LALKLQQLNERKVDAVWLNKRNAKTRVSFLPRTEGSEEEKMKEVRHTVLRTY